MDEQITKFQENERDENTGNMKGSHFIVTTLGISGVGFDSPVTRKYPRLGMIGDLEMLFQVDGRTYDRRTRRDASTLAWQLRRETMQSRRAMTESTWLEVGRERLESKLSGR